MASFAQRMLQPALKTTFQIPALTVHIESDLAYRGNLNATTAEGVQIDNYYFVDTQHNQINRIVYFQFAQAPAGHSLDHRSPDMRPIQLGDLPFCFDGGVRTFSQSLIDKRGAGSDVALTVDYLRQQGLTFVEGDPYALLRFMHYPQPSMDAELCLFYLEKATDVPESVARHSRSVPDWEPYCEQLLARALEVFSIHRE